MLTDLDREELEMSTEHKGNMIRDIPDERPILQNERRAGDLLKTEGPEGNPLWKKGKKLNEEDEETPMLNE